MQNKTKLLGLIMASLIAGTTAASAQGYYYGWNEPRPGWDTPAYETIQPRAYYPDPGPYGTLNGRIHPAPSSTQGDVGPAGNNNGTLTGVYHW